MEVRTGQVADRSRRGWGLRGWLERLVGLDRRCRFHDLARVAPAHRRACSPVIEFYSSSNNIGNFTPVLGIQRMLGLAPDTWTMHDRALDFDFVNRNYACAIIGGAGLLHGAFQPFWEAFAERCRIPVIIWGVGVCLPDGEESAVDRETVRRIAARCDLINIRDELTRDYYGLAQADISACPTLAYLEPLRSLVRPEPGRVLYSSHEEMVRGEETRRFVETARKACRELVFTDNIQRKREGVEDIIRRHYCRSELVVTTRLHGAIIAHGLGIPYVAVARDAKVRDFVRLYGNGACVETDEQLGAALAAGRPAIDRTGALEAVLAFGRRARAWVHDRTGSGRHQDRASHAA